MLSRGITLESGNNFDIFTTEISYNFGLNKYEDVNTTEQLWFDNDAENGRSLIDKNTVAPTKPETNKKVRSIGKKHKKKKHFKHKIKKCLYKLFKGKRKKFFKSKKFIMSLFMGLLLVKSIFITIILKTVALIAVKGLIMGFFSTVMASVFSLKGMFSHPYGHRPRKDEGRTRVEIFHVPDKHENIYYERPFRRNLVAFPGY